MANVVLTWPAIVSSDALAWVRGHAKYRRSVKAAELRRALARAPRTCTWCGKPAGKGRSTWCSPACVDSFQLTCDPARVVALIDYAADRALRQDRDARLGCELCGVDVLARVKLSRWLHRRANAGGWREYRGPFNRLGRKARRRRKRAKRALMLLRVRDGWRSPDRRRWELDHTIPVCEGGGCCGPSGLRVLCGPCHRRVTAELAARRAEKGR